MDLMDSWLETHVSEWTFFMACKESTTFKQLMVKMLLTSNSFLLPMSFNWSLMVMVLAAGGWRAAGGGSRLCSPQLSRQLLFTSVLWRTLDLCGRPFSLQCSRPGVRRVLPAYIYIGWVVPMV